MADSSSHPELPNWARGLAGSTALVTGAGRGLGRVGIRVNAIAPTFVDTPLTRPFFDDPEFAGFVGGMIPAGRLGRVEEIGAAVVYLASPASGIATGISLKLDGGWTAH